MKLEEIYRELQNEDVPIVWGNFNLKGAADAFTIRVDGTTAVCADLIKIRTEREEREALSHELAHIKTGTLYPLNASPSQIDRCETIANHYQIRQLVPFAELNAKVRDGLDEWDLAEYFGVSRTMVIDAVRYYVERCGMSLTVAS